MVNSLIESIKVNPFHTPHFKVGCEPCTKTESSESSTVARRFGAASAGIT